MAPRVWRRQIAAHLARRQIPFSRSKNGSSLADQVVGGSRRQNLNGEPGVGRSLRRHHAAVAHEQVVNVVGTAESIHYRCCGIAPHARRPDKVRVASLLHHLLRARGPHYFHRLVFREFNQLFVIFMEAEGYLGDA